MCGRYTLHAPLEIIEQIFRLVQSDGFPPPSYNIAPGQEVAVVVKASGGNRLASCRWGFLPPWAKGPANSRAMINARAETVAEKPGFREAFNTQRCLVVADGFFEWRTIGKAKKPVYVRLRNKEPFGFAGLHSAPAPDGERRCTIAVITTAANDLVRPVHDRMPVILPPDAYELWLDPAQDRDRLLALLRPFPSAEMELFAVSPGVNTPANNSPENIVPAGT